MQSIGSILKTANATYDNIVKTTILLSTMDDFAKGARTRRRRLHTFAVCHTAALYTTHTPLFSPSSRNPFAHATCIDVVSFIVHRVLCVCAVNAVYEKYFAGVAALPARATFAVAGLPKGGKVRYAHSLSRPATHTHTHIGIVLRALCVC